MAGWWFSLDTPVSSTNKTDGHDITEILLKVALNTITQRPYSMVTGGLEQSIERYINLTDSRKQFFYC
jgi:hypothetical protein